MTSSGAQPQPEPTTGSLEPDSAAPFENVFRAVSTTRSYEEVVRQVEAAVRAGHLERGERLPTERQLSKEFGVSRGVVREAIKVLGAMGLVEARQGSGIFVRNDTIPSVTRAFTLSVSPDAESVDLLFEFRRGLEVEAARLAVSRHNADHLQQAERALIAMEQASNPLDWAIFGQQDNNFHIAIARASGNPYLEVAIATARDMQRDVVNLISDQAGSIRIAIAQHRQIYEAIRERNSEKAGHLMATHVMYTADAVQSQFVSDQHRSTDGYTGKEGK